MKKSKNIKASAAITALSFITLFSAYSLWADKALSARAFEISDRKIPTSFDGFRIAHISDLHNTTFGKDNEELLYEIKKIKPDIIAVTGDSIDSRRTDINTAVDFFEKAIKIAPVYFVTGNHEARIPSYPEFETKIKELGVIYVNDTLIPIEKNGQKIGICGITDPAFTADTFEGRAFAAEQSLRSIDHAGFFSILLSHRPEFFSIYTKHGFSLVLSGHAHGGQFRFPFIGGLFAPDQGILPEYDSGLYENENTKMIVSRGLGNSAFPLRLFNRPEIITVILKHE